MPRKSDRHPCPVPSLWYVRAKLAAVGQAGTQAAEAERSKVARLTWSRWERGETTPSQEAVEAIACRWRVPIEALTCQADAKARMDFDGMVRAVSAAAAARALVLEYGAALAQEAVAAAIVAAEQRS